MRGVEDGFLRLPYALLDVLGVEDDVAEGNVASLAVLGDAEGDSAGPVRVGVGETAFDGAAGEDAKVRG